VNLELSWTNVEIAKAASSTLILGKRGFDEQVDLGIVDAYESTAKGMACNFSMNDSKERDICFFGKRPPKWN
jgi:hypothetical protein